MSKAEASRMSCANVFVALTVLIALYCSIDPFKHGVITKFPNFEAHKINAPPMSELPKEKDIEDLLQRSERRFLNQVQGPESIAFDVNGNGPYTGIADGRIVFWDGSKWNNFAYTSPNRSESCENQSLMSRLENEHICGRPLGLRFDKRSGNLYIADAYFGLMEVGREGGQAHVLSNQAEGIPTMFANDLDYDEDGNIYFTDSSTVFQRRNFLQLSFSAEDSGRLLKYDPVTKETIVLVRNLQFPNGVSLSKDGSFLLYCEGSIGRLTKYWLKGEKKGTSEPFAILPGFPDNVRTNEAGEFWVAIHCRRSMYSYLMGLYPWLRMFILRLPIPEKIHYLLNSGFPHGIILKYDTDGVLLNVLEDRRGKVIKAVSEVEERDGKLWLGSVLMPFIGVLDLSSTPIRG